mmetsp:Transcript_139871/g.446280  ORF Transcript_139871/g.446280 Transcript_139871/m.446280 type:complete len:206 (+) Transcript_139871:172-789(+)
MLVLEDVGVHGVEHLDHILDLGFADALAQHLGDLVQLIDIQQVVLVLVHAGEDVLLLGVVVLRGELLRKQLVELLGRDLTVEVLVDVGHDPRDRTGQVVGIHTEQLEHLLQLLHVYGPRVVLVDNAEHLLDQPLLVVDDADARAGAAAEEAAAGPRGADVRQVRAKGHAVRSLLALDATPSAGSAHPAGSGHGCEGSEGGRHKQH